MGRFFALALALAAVFPLTGAAVEMPERFNVGGYVKVPGAPSYRLVPAATPSPLPASGSAAHDSAVAAAKTYLADFPKTTALMLLDADGVVFEAYRGMGNPEAEFFSMSIAKSLTSLAVGKAVCAGKIESLDVAARRLVPELDNNNFGRATIRQLLTMRSGAYVPRFAGQPKFKTGIGQSPLTGKPFHVQFWPIRLGQVTISDLLWGQGWEDVVKDGAQPPGEQFYYKSGDTMTLGLVVQRATDMTLAEYFEREIWQGLGPEGTAHWETDRDGVTTAASGFQARLRDWARLARWILAEYPKQDCFGNYVRDATRQHTSTQSPGKRLQNPLRGYGYQWWTDNIHAPGFWAAGYAGQYMGIDPESKKIVIKFSYATDGPSRRALFNIFKEWSAAP